MQLLLLGNVSDMMVAGLVSFRKSFNRWSFSKFWKIFSRKKRNGGCFRAINPLDVAFIVLRKGTCDLSRAAKSRGHNDFPLTRAEIIFGQCVRATCISNNFQTFTSPTQFQIERLKVGFFRIQAYSFSLLVCLLLGSGTTCFVRNFENCQVLIFFVLIFDVPNNTCAKLCTFSRSVCEMLGLVCIVQFFYLCTCEMFSSPLLALLLHSPKD